MKEKAAQRVRQALKKFRDRASVETVAGLEKLIERGHQQAVAALKGDLDSGLEQNHLAWVRTALGETDEPLHDLVTAEAIGMGDGGILGIGKFELLDPMWAEALVVYLEHLEDRAAFPVDPQHIEAADRLALAFVGDWGTGYWRRDTPAENVAKLVEKMRPDYSFHLGDVYYAGTASQEKDHLLGIWPRGKQGQFVLNSNHEMYSGGLNYFNTAIPTLAPQQQNTSYFAISNRNWLIIGLDSAYYASDMYMNGSLGQDNAQTRFLTGLKTEATNKKVIILSHHQGLEMDGKKTTKLYDQIFELLGRIPDYWYWGHLHNAIVYQQVQSGQVQSCFHGRCTGHGAVPYANASQLKGQPAVAWYEQTLANDPECKTRVLGGFVHVVLDGTDIHERYIGEDGSIRWQLKPSKKG